MTLAELTRLAARVAELELRVARHADTVDAGASEGATSTANFSAHRTRQTRTETHRKMRLSAALEARPVLRGALSTGAVRLDQARVIAAAVEAVPVEHADRAEGLLIRFAADHDPKTLTVLGRRILAYVDPEAADAHEAKLVDQEERRAAQSTRLTMADDGHGRVHGRFTIPARHAAMLKKALLAIAAPKHRASVDGGQGERRPTAKRLGQAFCEYVERYPADRLPQTGGGNATVVVTMDLSTLAGGVKAARLDTGETVSGSEARRLACEAGIIPAVLGGMSQVLDLGRKTRFHTRSQRIAMGIEQGGCAAVGCYWPPGLCHAHHAIPWSRGGDTSVKDGILLCPRHHTHAHDSTYSTTRTPDGKVAFARHR